jgi:ArsR family transcriptional regulator
MLPYAALKALADANRLRILEFFLAPVHTCCTPDEGVCSCDLERHLDLSQPAVHHHMRILVDAGLVRAERRGRWVYYALAPDALHGLAGQLDAFADRAEALPATRVGGPCARRDADATPAPTAKAGAEDASRASTPAEVPQAD